VAAWMRRRAIPARRTQFEWHDVDARTLDARRPTFPNLFLFCPSNQIDCAPGPQPWGWDRGLWIVVTLVSIRARCEGGGGIIIRGREPSVEPVTYEQRCKVQVQVL
jgi:hypothetical protein